jgi:hypothetical protein
MVKTRVVDLDPDSMNLWIRIQKFNPDTGSGSRGQKRKENVPYFLVNK